MQLARMPRARARARAKLISPAGLSRNQKQTRVTSTAELTVPTTLKNHALSSIRQLSHPTNTSNYLQPSPPLL